jgi:bacteriocin-like protein
MKRTHTTTKAPARTAVLTQKELARVIGGTGGTIIVENVVVLPQGIQGTGRP